MLIVGILKSLVKLKENKILYFYHLGNKHCKPRDIFCLSTVLM